MTKARDIASAAPAPSTVSATELGYLDGVSSAIQTQIDGKSSTAHNHDSAYLNQSVIDAKGDLLVGTADNAYGRLAVSDNGSTLVADSSTSTGLRYNPQNALANLVINGGMDVWQRGTSLSIAASTNFGASSFMADRWQTQTGANQACTISRQTVSDSTNLPNIQYALRFQRNSGQTGTGTLQFYQNFETANSIPLAGKTITVSFYARKGANYSDAASDVNFIGWQGTGTDQNIWSGYTGASTFFDNNFVLTTSWQRFAVTATIASTTKELALGFRWDPTGTAGADDWLEITGVQIDVGTYTASSAPTFRRSGGTLQGELAACQRYYFSIARANAQDVNIPVARVATTSAEATYYLPVPMRSAPSVDNTGVGGVFGRLVGYDTAFAVTVVNVTNVGIVAQYANQAVSLGFTNATMTQAAAAASCQFDNGNVASTLALTAEL